MSRNVPQAFLAWTLLVLVIGIIGGLVRWHNQPTPDQLYGCTVQQRAPTGECK